MEILVLVFGLVIGSFLNVCIYRIPRKESVVTVPSHCPDCNTKLKPYDLIPVFSYLFLKGKCRYCSAKISIRYPLVESLNACYSVLLAFRIEHPFNTKLILCSVTGDIRH